MSKRRDRVTGPMSSRPIAPILSAAREEAALARHGYVGLEHLLLALARPEHSVVGVLLADSGAALSRARDAVWLVVGTGRGDGPRFDGGSLLATLGIDLDQIRRHVERQFGPDAMHNLYSSPVGWNLRPRGPLCDLPLSPSLKRAVWEALGRCWDTAPTQLPERLLLAALDADSRGLTGVLEQLGVQAAELRRSLSQRLKIAS